MHPEKMWQGNAWARFFAAALLALAAVIALTIILNMPVHLSGPSFGELFPAQAPADVQQARTVLVQALSTASSTSSADAAAHAAMLQELGTNTGGAQDASAKQHLLMRLQGQL